MKTKRLLSVLSLFCLMSVDVMGDGGQWEDGETKVNYQLDFVKGEAIVIDSPFAAGDIDLPSKVNYNGKDYTVTCISSFAFSECSGLTSITIPSSVTSIEQQAFQYCTGLTSITIPSNVTKIGSGVFYNCSGLTSVTFLDGAKKVGETMFMGCSKLVTVNLPKTISVIDYGAFKDCASLKSIAIPEGVKKLSGTFTGCTSLHTVTLPIKSLTSMEQVFSGSGIDSLIIPNSVKTIGFSEFVGCSNLCYLDIGDGLTEMEQESLYGCLKLKFLRIGKNLTKVEYSQWRCAELPNLEEVVSDSKKPLWTKWYSSVNKKPLSLTYGGNAEEVIVSQENLVSLKIGEKVNKIESCEFYGSGSSLPNLVSIVVSSENPIYDSRENCNAIIETATNTLIIGSNNSNIPNSVTAIGNYAFATRKITSVQIPNSVTKIGREAFFNTDLNTVTIPNSVVELMDRVFCQCEKLKSAVLGDGITNIYQGLFEDCSQLQFVSIGKGLEGFEKDRDNIYFGYDGYYQAAFTRCNALEEAFVNCNVPIRFPDALKKITIGNDVKVINKGWKFRGLTNMIIGSNCSYIDGEVYTNLPELESIEVNKDNTYINSRNNCNAVIETATQKLLFGGAHAFIPYGVVCIGQCAFYERALNTIVIPNSVKEIQAQAFEYCSGLTKVHSMIEEPFSINGNVFSNYNIPLYVPVGSKTKYENTKGWKNFNNIVEVSEQPKGDVNGDLAVNVADIGSIIDVMARSGNDAAADVNGDGVVNVADIAAIIDIMAANARELKSED